MGTVMFVMVLVALGLGILGYRRLMARLLVVVQAVAALEQQQAALEAQRQAVRDAVGARLGGNSPGRVALRERLAMRGHE